MVCSSRRNTCRSVRRFNIAIACSPLFEIDGTVRFSDPEGVGIEFTDLTDVHRKRVDELIAEFLRMKFWLDARYGDLLARLRDCLVWVIFSRVGRYILKWGHSEPGCALSFRAPPSSFFFVRVRAG